MKAEELRLGNLVIDPLGEKYNYNGVSRVIKIYDNTFDTKDIEYGGGHINAKSVMKPIKLTPEWLVRMGFELHEYDNEVEFNEWILSDDSFMIMYIKKVNQYEIYYNDSPNIKYVHQLQNLYRALTGKELTIKQNETLAI